MLPSFVSSSIAPSTFDSLPLAVPVWPMVVVTALLHRVDSSHVIPLNSPAVCFDPQNPPAKVARNRTEEVLTQRAFEASTTQSRQ